MTRTSFLGILGAFCAFSQTPAQNPRDAYRSAYRAWREADPSLERDAATAGPGIVALRAAHLAQEQAKYAVERRKFLEGLIATGDRTLSWLEQARTTESSVTPPKGLDDNLATEDAAVRRGVETFANDTDRGIQPLRQALERERRALADLTAAVQEERKATESYTEAAAGTEGLILQATAEERRLAAGIQQTREEAKRDDNAWATYYRSLAIPPSAPSPADTH